MKQTHSQLIKGLPRRIALMLLDCGLITLCYYLAILLRFDGEDAFKRPDAYAAMAGYLPFLLGIYMIVFWFGGLYEILWEYAGLRDLARLTLLTGLATGTSMILEMLYRGTLGVQPVLKVGPLRFSPMFSGTVLIFGAVLGVSAI